ncbi:CD109 antigen [Gouania willdenowi]|uniref:CD109 molecule n=1 Tax=Gouania willdenowi TaxID=441366 RepID=A0A8C5N765_GOUWI|nr:CD109 antigen [Gouania willdenowi]
MSICNSSGLVVRQIVKICTRMSRIWVLVVCLAAGGLTQKSSGILYVISGPEVVHAGTATTLAVTVFGKSSVKVVAEASNGNTKVSQTEEFQEGLTKLLVIPPILGATTQSSLLNLTVKGYRTDTLLFTNTTIIRFKHRSVSSFIQMDRSHYEPGDTVKVRIVSTSMDNRPYKGKVDISVWDPSGNVVERWESTGNLGIVLQGFRLSRTAPVGQWTVTATVDGGSEEKNFTVQHHEPPHFKVLIKSPSIVLIGDDLSGSVRALYPSGQPVQGTVAVSVVLDPDVNSEASPILLTGTTEIYGSAHFSFSAEQLQVLQASSTFVHIDVCVNDESKDFKVNKTVKVQWVEKTFQLRFHTYPSTLKPTLHFYANLSISRYDRKSLSSLDLMNPVTVEVTQNSSAVNIESTVLTLPVPKDGNVHFRFKIKPQVEILLIQARFQSCVETLKMYSNHSSPSGSYIQINPVNSGDACIGMPLHLDVESNFQVTKLHFVVSSKGGVLTAGTNNSSFLSLTPTLSWSPTACFTIYCILPDGQVTADTTCLPVSQHCNLGLQWSSVRAQPGDKVSLHVSGLESKSRVEVVVIGTQEEVLEPNLDLKWKQESHLTMLTNTGLYGRRKQSGEEGHGFSEDEGLMVQAYWSHWSESLLWLYTDVSEETWVSEDIVVPDGFTSLSALTLVMSEPQGLRFNHAPLKLDISKDFTLSLDVPSQLIRGEEIVLEVNVINHLEHSVDIIVLLAQSESFEFVLTDRNNMSFINAQKLSLGSHQSASALFPIRALALGEMEISVDGVSSDATCSLIRRVMVEPEGIPQSYSQTLLLEIVPGKEDIPTSVSFSFPPDVVAGSQRANVVVVGDILALPLNNLNRLVEMPLSCGESNMIHFASSVSVLQYLNKTANDNKEIRRKALSYMMKAYQKQLSYQLQDGSFSPFGKSNLSGSTWLSAFVLRCFLQAEFFMPIDQTVLDKTRSWLLKNQKLQGEFSEAGRLLHTEMQEGLDSSPVALTAYVLVALLENGSYECSRKTEQGVMNSDGIILAQKYLEKQILVGVVSNYSLCLTAYALALAESPLADVALTELKRRADRKDGVMIWTSSSGLTSYDPEPGSVQIEMASYVLLALLRRGGFVEGIALMKWLSEQTNHPRGYGTTQDTVVALQAMVCYAVYSGANTIDLRFNISDQTSSLEYMLHINPSNYQEYQSKEISANKDLHLHIHMDGKGFGIFQLNVFYNRKSKTFSQSLQPTTDSGAFSLTAEVTGASDSDHMLSICTRLKDNQAVPRTGTVLMEVGMLSGFTLAPNPAVSTDLIWKVETVPNAVILYLDSLTKSEVCFKLPIIRKYNVAHVLDAAVVVYDYHEQNRRTTASYNSPVLHETDICFFCGANCENCWPGITITMSSSSREAKVSFSLVFGLIMLIAVL